MRLTSILKLFVLTPLATGVVLSFQNCSPVSFKAISSGSITSASIAPNICTTTPDAAECSKNIKCYFNGQVYNEGESVKAYLSSTVANGQVCASEDRICSSGNFSGSYMYGSCRMGAPAACLFDGKTIAHGDSIKAFQNSAVPFGNTCQSQIRICNDGTLSGSYNFGNCLVGGASSCLFNGQTLAHGASVNAYPNSSVPFGQTCQAVARTCNNGVLSGSAAYASCTPGAAASCLFNGQTVVSGGSIKAYQNSSVAYGATCQSQDRVCTNGALGGSFSFSTCNPESPASCLFNGQTVANGQSVTAFQSSSVGYGQSCLSQSRLCTNGSLSGSYVYGACTGTNPASCIFNGQTIANGQSVLAYSSSTVPYGSSCSSQSRVCSNGTLGGSFTYASCIADQAVPKASCTFNGQTLAHGQSVTAYANSSVPYGSSCSSQSRTCNDGTLQGSYAYGTCFVQSAPPQNCSFNGQSVPNGSSVTAYAATSVAYGQSCQSQQRTCSNGTLTGSYNASTCSVQAAASCYYPGGPLGWGAGGCTAPSGALTIGHGQTTSFTSTAAMAKGNITYSCNNGMFQVASESCTPVVLSSGQHCDIGGPWGWKATDARCPAGQKPVSAESIGGCPAGFSSYNAGGVTGCYIGNSNPARPSSCTGDPRDECCMWACAANQTSVVRWKCTYLVTSPGARAGGTCTTNRKVSGRDTSYISESSCAAHYGAENCDPDVETIYVPYSEGGFG